MLVAAVTFSVVSIGLWLFPMGLGQLATPWNVLGLTASIMAGLASGLATRRHAAALGSFAAALLGLASAWALTKLIDPSRPEGELMVVAWATLALLVGAMHLVGVVLPMHAQPRGRGTP